MSHVCVRVVLVESSSNTKKKPNSLTIGRIFDKKVLDMVEFEIVKLEEIDDGKVRLE